MTKKTGGAFELLIKDGILLGTCGACPEEVAIPEGVWKIAGRAFEGCGALKRVIIPACVRAIGEDAFAGCKSLKEIVIP